MKKDNKYNLDLDNNENIDVTDSDSDGLSDYEEVNVYSTDPYNPDTDGDGMSDGDEVKAGRNPKGPGMLKDLFVPHAGNDYKPHVLHPWRLAFHAIAAILIKILVVIFVLIFPIEAWLTPDIQIEESKKIISLTNEIRQSLGVNLLKESNTLTQAAFKKAEDMLINQYFAHVGLDGKSLSTWLKLVGYNYATAGENLAMGFANSEDVVNGWVRSSTHYANIIDPDFSEIGVGMASGAYKDNDTTFVAQYFGTPNVFLAVSNVEEKKVLAIEDISDIVPTESTETPDESKVLAEEIAQHTLSSSLEGNNQEEIVVAELKQPKLISPQNGYLTSNEEVEFNIFAPIAEIVNIYDNNQKILEINDLEYEHISFDVELLEGSHIIKLESIRGEESIFSEDYIITIDTSAPAIDIQETRLTVSQAEGQKSIIVRAEAILSADTKQAEVNFGNYKIILSPEDGDVNKWVGHTMIFNEDEEQIFNPVVLANLTASDFVGNESTQDINWENIIPVKPSLLNQYLFVRSNQSKYLKPIFGLSSWYFKFLMVVLSIVLFLNIFIEIKKQHPHVIVSTIGLIGLLFVLIIL